MQTWTVNDAEIVISSRGTGMGTVYIVIAIIGVILATIAGLVLVGMLISAIDERSLPGTGAGIALVAMLIALIFLVSGTSSRKRMNFASTVRLDRTAHTIDFSRGDEPGFRHAFGDVAFIELHRGNARGSSESSRLPWAIFLTLRDGSRFWLDTFSITEEWASRVMQLHTLTGLAVVDRTGDPAGIQLVREATRTDPADTPAEYASAVSSVAVASVAAAPPVPSAFLVETVTGGRTEFRLKKKTDAAGRFLMVAVFSLFFAAPAIVIGPLLFEAIADPAPASILIALAAGMFGIFFLLIVFLVLLVQGREIAVAADAFRVTVTVRFRPAILNRWLGRSFSIEASRLRAIRVNRLDQGHFWLSLVVDATAQPGDAWTASPLHSVLLGMGNFSRRGADHTSGQERLIGLWEVPGWSRQGWGATVHDLRYIEWRLQSILGLNEQPVTP